MIEELLSKYPKCFGPILITMDDGRKVWSENPGTIGKQYIIILEKTGEEYSAVSSPVLQHQGIPGKLTKADNKKPEHLCSGFSVVAERTGLEPATPCVTGRYSNQLNYRSAFSRRARTIPRPRLLGAWQCPTLAWRMPH